MEVAARCANNCGKLASPYKKYCSHICYSEARWPKDNRKFKKIDGEWYRTQCIECNKWRKTYKLGKCHECRWKDERNPVIAHGIVIPQYHAVHWWVNKQFGKPTECEECGLIDNNSRRFHWANLSGLYKKDRSDWLRLCVSCHKLMDNKRKEVKV